MTVTTNVLETLRQNISFENTHMIVDLALNCLRKNANYSGPITQAELATLGPEPNIHHWRGSNIVIIGRDTYNAYRRQAGYTGEVSKAEKQRAKRMIARGEVNAQLPAEVPEM